jgi:hypothetical protein
MDHLFRLEWEKGNQFRGESSDPLCLCSFMKSVVALIIAVGSIAPSVAHSAELPSYATSSTATLDQIHTANTIGNATPDVVRKIHFLHTFKDDKTALDNFSYYEKTGGFGRPFDDQLTDLVDFMVLGTASPATTYAESGALLYGGATGVTAISRLAQDIYRGPLIQIELSQQGALATPTAVEAINDLEELKESAKTNSTLNDILKKEGFLDDHNELTPNAKDLLQRNLILDAGYLDELKTNSGARSSLTSSTTQDLTAKKEAIKNKPAPQPNTQSNDGDELIGTGREIEADGTVLYTVGRITKSRTLQNVGQGTQALGQFSQALGTYEKVGNATNAALAASSGLGLAMVAMSMFEPSQDDSTASILDSLRNIQQELFNIEDQLNELSGITVEGFENLNLKADYGIALAQDAKDQDLKNWYRNTQTLSDTNKNDERDYLSIVNGDMPYCLDPTGPRDDVALSKCFVDFKNVISRLSQYSLKASTGAELTDSDIFRYQTWVMRSWGSDVDALYPFEPKTSANLSDMISLFNQGLPRSFGLQGADALADMDLWLQVTNAYAVFLSALRSHHIEPNTLPGYGSSFDQPVTTWQTLVSQGDNFKDFVNQSLYSVGGYTNLAHNINNDVLQLSKIIKAAYDSSSSLMKSKNWATPSDSTGAGTNHGTTTVNHSCDTSKYPDLGLSLTLPSGETFGDFVPTDYWVAQFLGGGVVDLCYKYNLRNSNTNAFDFDFEIQGRFKLKDGSDTLVAARDFRSNMINAQMNSYAFPTTATFVINLAWVRDNHYVGGLPLETAWKSIFYDQLNAVQSVLDTPTNRHLVFEHNALLFGENVAAASDGQKLALNSLVKRLESIIPNVDTGEIPDDGGSVASYFNSSGIINQDLPGAVLTLYSHTNELILAAKIQTSLTSGASSCYKSLGDFTPTKLIDIALTSTFLSDAEMQQQISSQLAAPTAALLQYCSSAAPKGIILLNIVDGLKQAVAPQRKVSTGVRLPFILAVISLISVALLLLTFIQVQRWRRGSDTRKMRAVAD